MSGLQNALDLVSRACYPNSETHKEGQIEDHLQLRKPLQVPHMSFRTPLLLGVGARGLKCGTFKSDVHCPPPKLTYQGQPFSCQNGSQSPKRPSKQGSLVASPTTFPSLNPMSRHADGTLKASGPVTVRKQHLLQLTMATSTWTGWCRLPLAEAVGPLSILFDWKFGAWREKGFSWAVMRRPIHVRLNVVVALTNGSVQFSRINFKKIFE